VDWEGALRHIQKNEKKQTTTHTTHTKKKKQIINTSQHPTKPVVGRGQIGKR